VIYYKIPVIFRLLPFENPNPENDFVNTEIMYDNLINNFHFRGLDNPNAYFSEDYRNFVVNHRSSFNTLAEALIDEGKMERAREVALKGLELMPDNAIPYDYTTTRMVNILYTVGENKKAVEIAEIMGLRADEELQYYIDNFKTVGFETQKNIIILNDLGRTLTRYGEEELAKKFNDALQEHYARLQVYNNRRR